MLFSSLPLLCLGLAVEVLSIPHLLSKPESHGIWPHVRRQANNSQTVLPMYDANPTARAQAILATRKGFLYGASPVGNTSFYPAGPLGNASITADFNLLSQDAATIAAAAGADVALAFAAVQNHGGINNISDYALLYDGQWKQSFPEGIDPGILTNYTSDLLFSMERLSLNPYNLVRLNPKTSQLPFQVDAKIVANLAGVSLDTLFTTGSLFYIDYSSQSAYPTTQLFTAYCSAYFYIHPISGEFLPLAIRTNTGSDLIYTPLDTTEDWLLAKVMFEINDLFHSQFVHLASTHAAGEIVWEAAIRTLSENHPIYALLKRLMFEAFAIRTNGARLLYAPNGLVDEFFAITHVGAEDIAHDFYYPTTTIPSVGAIQAKYLQTDLTARGLINCPYGPPLLSIPFNEDASVIVSEITEFMTAFVNSYYANDAIIKADYELQAWVKESNGAAQVIDFPAIQDTRTLIDVLTHIAFLTGVKHHSVNTGTPVASLGVLPLHNFALYQPVPTAKGVTNVFPFLTPTTQALGQVDLLSQFGRPAYVSQNRTLTYMFSDDSFLSQFHSSLQGPAESFRAAMMALSAKIRARTFDWNGLSQGMPFVYRQLDPGVIPFFFAV